MIIIWPQAPAEIWQLVALISLLAVLQGNKHPLLAMNSIEYRLAHAHIFIYTHQGCTFGGDMITPNYFRNQKEHIERMKARVPGSTLRWIFGSLPRCCRPSVGQGCWAKNQHETHNSMYFFKSQGVMMQASNICIHVGNCRYRITICKHLLGLLYFLWWFCFASCGYMRGWLMVKVVGLLSYKTGFFSCRKCLESYVNDGDGPRVHIPVPRCPGEPHDGVRNRKKCMAFCNFMGHPWNHSEKLKLFAPVFFWPSQKETHGRKPRCFRRELFVAGRVLKISCHRSSKPQELQLKVNPLKVEELLRCAVPGGAGETQLSGWVLSEACWNILLTTFSEVECNGSNGFGKVLLIVQKSKRKTTWDV